MRNRCTLAPLLPIWCLLLLLSGCAADKASPTPTATVGPSFTETTPLVIRPPRFPVNNLAWSPDGKRVAIANADGIFQVWETATGRLISTHDDRDRSMKISILGWSADGRRIISTVLGPGTTVQVWDAATGNTLVTFSHSYPVAISHDGKLVAVGSGGSVQIWETSTGQQIATFDTATSHVDQLAWSPDGSLLATTNTQQTANGATDYTIQVWRAATGQHISTYRPPAHNALYALTWSPDNKRIASTEGLGPTTNAVIGRVWDATSGMPMFSLPIATGQASGLVWSPDGARVATWYNASPGQIAQVWDAATGKLLYTTADQGVTSVAWSPDSRHIAVAGQQMNLRILDAATGQMLITYQGAVNQRIVTWSPDEQHLASVGEEGTTIWEAGADQRAAALAAPPRRNARSPGRPMANRSPPRMAQTWMPASGMPPPVIVLVISNSIMRTCSAYSTIETPLPLPGPMMARTLLSAGPPVSRMAHPNSRSMSGATPRPCVAWMKIVLFLAGAMRRRLPLSPGRPIASALPLPAWITPF